MRLSRAVMALIGEKNRGRRRRVTGHLGVGRG
jgi:hypothetical protein